MAFGARFCVCLLFAFFLVSSARNIIFFPGEEGLTMVGRSLKVIPDDYGEPTANRGHDPGRNKGGGGNGGRKG